MSFKNDYHLGTESEKAIQPLLEEAFGELRRTDKFCCFDFENDEYVVELKTRRVSRCAYPTTMIGVDKVCKALKTGRRVILAFSFTDGSFYIEATPETLRNYSVQRGGRCDRGRPEMNSYYFIPVEKLKKIEK